MPYFQIQIWYVVLKLLLEIVYQLCITVRYNELEREVQPILDELKSSLKEPYYHAK